MKILFGLPIAYGLKRRIANKYFRRYWRKYRRNEKDYHAWLNELSNYSVGSIVHTCAGLNDKVKEVEPQYKGIRGGGVLVDVHITTTNNSCSLKHCGISKAMSYEDACKNAEFYRTRPDAKGWGWDIRYSPEVMTIHPDGTYTINYELERKLEEIKKVKS